MKNNAILKAGKTKPTIGTKIDGKNDAAISERTNNLIFVFIGKIVNLTYR
jgi:hypothetical protein